MLEHVTVNQTHFIAPGLSADARGIAVGRYCIILLPSLDRVIGLLRGLSEADQLEDLTPTLRLFQVKTPLQSHEFIMQVPVTGSNIADSLAAICALMGGLTFTGSSKHFVKYRDGHSPMGYDLDNLYSGQGDFILYDTEFVQAYHKEREIAFSSLALNLSLEIARDDSPLADEQILLRVEPGLWRMVAGYLHRHQLPCEVAACELSGNAPVRKFFLLRGRIKARMATLFRSTPGIELYRLVTSRVAVQVGFQHPLELGSCQSIFSSQHFYLFSGTRNVLDVLTMPPVFVNVEALMNLGQSVRAISNTLSKNAAVPQLEVPLKLAPSLSTSPAVVALRIPASQAPWLKKLVYLLPPQALEHCTVCLTEEQIFINGERGIEFIPLGEPFYQTAPGVLVPVGFELLPRIRPEILIDHLGGGPDQLIFFLREQPCPIQLPLSEFQLLSRRSLAQIQVDRLPPMAADSATSSTPSIQNSPLGLFPLWGFTDDSGQEKE